MELKPNVRMEIPNSRPVVVPLKETYEICSTWQRQVSSSSLDNDHCVQKSPKYSISYGVHRDGISI